MEVITLETQEFQKFFDSQKFKFILYFSAIFLSIFLIAPIIILSFLFVQIEWHNSFFFLIIFFIFWYSLILWGLKKNVYSLYLDKNAHKVKIVSLIYQNYTYRKGRLYLHFTDNQKKTYTYPLFFSNLNIQEPEPVKLWLSYYSETILKIEFLKSGIQYNVNDFV